MIVFRGKNDVNRIENSANQREHVSDINGPCVAGAEREQADSCDGHYRTQKDVPCRAALCNCPQKQRNQEHVNRGEKCVFASGGVFAAYCLHEIGCEKIETQNSAMKPGLERKGFQFSSIYKSKN